MGGNPGQEQAGRTARAAAEFRALLSDTALPAIKDALAGMQADLGAPGELPPSVAAAFGSARESVRKDYETENAVGKAGLQQAIKQSGMMANPEAVSFTTKQLERSLSQSRDRSLRALQFQEAQAGESQTGFLLNQITGVTGNVLSGTMGFGQNALNTSNLLTQAYQQRSQQASGYGAIAGAILGTVIGGPGVGTALGSAAGGAVGGWLGGG